MRLCIVQPALNVVSETFIRAHAEHLPGPVSVVHGNPPVIGETPAVSQSWLSRACRKGSRLLRRNDPQYGTTLAFRSAFRQVRAEAVLAEYGTTGVQVLRACNESRIPLIVHFHGYDASAQKIIDSHRDRYREMFRRCAAVIAVSKAMHSRLLELGALPERTHYNPYGVECDRFAQAPHREAGPIFLSVGRFVEKKAPHLTILAFERAWRRCPAARLRMIGYGPLFGVCKDLIQALGLSSAVTTLGAQPHSVVLDEMQRARAFVQHSVTAADGDSEGTPVAILEAGACGLPVISTRHAGIPDVIVEGETGMLVDERDVVGMSELMLRLADDPGSSARMGQNATSHVRSHYNMPVSIGRLWSIIQSCTGKG